MNVDLVHEMYYNLYIILCTLVSYLYKLYTNYDKVLMMSSMMYLRCLLMMSCMMYLRCLLDVMHDVLRCLLDVMHDVLRFLLDVMNDFNERYLYKLNTSISRWHANDVV